MTGATAERDDAAAAYHIKQVFGLDLAQPYVGLVFHNRGEHVATAIVNGYGHGNCFLTLVITGPVTMGQARYLFRYIFEQLDCQRITATTLTTNGRAIHAMRKMGFRYEGILRGYYNGRDAAVYGLLRSEQRLIK